MKGLYKHFGTDKKAENEGVWIEYENDDGSVAAFKISSMGKTNKKYAKCFEVKTRKVKHSINSGTISDSKSEKIIKEVFVESVLIDWKGVTDKKGELMEFTKENAMKLFHDLPRLYDDLTEQAQNASTFRQKEMEDDSKN